MPLYVTWLQPRLSFTTVTFSPFLSTPNTLDVLFWLARTFTAVFAVTVFDTCAFVAFAVVFFVGATFFVEAFAGVAFFTGAFLESTCLPGMLR